MNEKTAGILGARARFGVLWPSEEMREVLCPFSSNTSAGLAWRQGWERGDRAAKQLEVHRQDLLKLHLAELMDAVPITVTGFQKGKKIATIEAIMKHLGLGLKESKQLAESLPRVLGAWPEDQAENIVADMRSVGVIAQLPSGVERLSEALKTEV